MTIPQMSRDTHQGFHPCPFAETSFLCNAPDNLPNTSTFLFIASTVCPPSARVPPEEMELLASPSSPHPHILRHHNQGMSVFATFTAELIHPPNFHLLTPRHFINYSSSPSCPQQPLSSYVSPPHCVLPAVKHLLPHPLVYIYSASFALTFACKPKRHYAPRPAHLHRIIFPSKK